MSSPYIYLRRVVNNDRFPQISTKNVKIFNIVSVDTDAMLPEQSVLNPIPFRIQKIHQFVRINLNEKFMKTLRRDDKNFDYLFACRKKNKFKSLGHF